MDIPETTATRRPVGALSPPSSKRIRSGLLTKLGIQPREPQDRVPMTAPRKDVSLLGPMIIVKTPLKQDPGRSTTEQRASKSLWDMGLLLFSTSPSSSMDENDTVTSVSSHSIDSSSSSAPTSLSVLDGTSKKDRLSIHFNEEVSLIYIPRRDEYSKRMREQLWESPEVLQANTWRNSIEFAADGWNWRHARDEDEHLVCPTSGELVHPIHVEIAKKVRRERGLPECSEDDLETLLNTSL